MISNIFKVQCLWLLLLIFSTTANYTADNSGALIKEYQMLQAELLSLEQQLEHYTKLETPLVERKAYIEKVIAMVTRLEQLDKKISLEISPEFSPVIYRLVAVNTTETRELSKGYTSQYNENELGGSYRYQYKGGWGAVNYQVNVGLTAIPIQIVLGEPFEFHGKITIETSFSEKHHCHTNNISRLDQASKVNCRTQGQEVSFLIPHSGHNSVDIKLNPTGTTDFFVKFNLASCTVSDRSSSILSSDKASCDSEKGQMLIQTGKYRGIHYTYTATSNVKGFKPEKMYFTTDWPLGLSINEQGFVEQGADVKDHYFQTLKTELAKSDSKYNLEFKLWNQKLTTATTYKPVLANEKYLTSITTFKFPDGSGGEIAKVNAMKKNGAGLSASGIVSITGKTYKDAVVILKDAGLVVLPPEIGSRAENAADVGKIERIKPLVKGAFNPGDKVIPQLYGQVVTSAQVPSVVGLDIKTAAERISTAGFKPVFELGENTADPGKDKTISKQDPNPGLAVKAGSQITLFVYRLKKSSVTLPDLSGMSLANARQVLEELGLKIKPELGKPASGGNTIGQVYHQSMEAGLALKKGSAIKVLVYGRTKIKPENKITTNLINKSPVPGKPNWDNGCRFENNTGGATLLWKLRDPPPYSGLTPICSDRDGVLWILGNRVLRIVKTSAGYNGCFSGAKVWAQNRQYGGTLCPASKQSLQVIITSPDDNNSNLLGGCNGLLGTDAC